MAGAAFTTSGLAAYLRGCTVRKYSVSTGSTGQYCFQKDNRPRDTEDEDPKWTLQPTPYMHIIAFPEDLQVLGKYRYEDYSTSSPSPGVYCFIMRGR